MIQDDFRVEVIGHATLRVQAGGHTLLTDPWLVGSIGSNLAAPFPPVVHDPARVAAETDAIYLSHNHPDHLNPATLAFFPRHIPIYIGAYRSRHFRDSVAALGFAAVEVPFAQPTPLPGTPFEITILEHDVIDSAAYDSAIVIRTPAWTLFENNDCFLEPDRYRWVQATFRPDYAFLGYSPASFFPISFEMPPHEKARLLAAAAEQRYDDFVATAGLVGARLSVPFASSLRFLRESALWRNVAFNSATDAVCRLRSAGLAGEVMGPGDRIAADGAIVRVSAVRERDEELAAIGAYASREQARLLAAAPPDPPPHDDVLLRLRSYILARWSAVLAAHPGVDRPVIAYRLEGDVRQECYFDFSRALPDIFQLGSAPRYDMRYTYPAGQLQQALDGALDWDDLHFLSDVSIHQVRYARDFYVMLRGGRLARAEPGRLP
jgi:Beta-lactamase superfamily domain